MVMSINKKVKTFSDLYKGLKNSFYRTYVRDGQDSVEKTLNGKRANYGTEEINENYKYDLRKTPSTAITTFLGLPNRSLFLDGDTVEIIDNNNKMKAIPKSGELMNVVKNFFGWQPNKSLPRNFFNFLLVTPINLITTPFKFALNVLKLGTEVLPAFLHKLSIFIGYNLKDAAKQLYANRALSLSGATFFSLAALIIIPAVVMEYARYPLWAAYMLGRSLTSPIDSLRDTWKTNTGWGRDADGDRFKKSTPRAIALTALHLLVIAGVYTIALPVLSQALIGLLLPILAVSLPSSVFIAVFKVVNAITPALTAISKVALPLANIVLLELTRLTGLNAIAASMPALAGFGAVAGIGLGLVGTGLNKLVNQFREWWHKPVKISVLGYENENNAGNDDSFNKGFSYDSADDEQSLFREKQQDQMSSLRKSQSGVHNEEAPKPPAKVEHYSSPLKTQSDLAPGFKVIKDTQEPAKATFS